MTRSIYPVSEKILWKEYRALAPATSARRAYLGVMALGRRALALAVLAGAVLLCRCGANLRCPGQRRAVWPGLRALVHRNERNDKHWIAGSLL
jgi:hypothetical protein